MKDLKLSPLTTLGAILTHLEGLPELERWEVQLQVMTWLRKRIPSLSNRNPEPVRLVK